MKIYWYDNHHLTYKVLPIRWVVIVLIFLSISMFSIGYKVSLPTEFEDLTEYEGEVLVLSIKDTIHNFTEDKLIDLIKQLNIKFPHIALAQSKIETGNYSSRIFRENHNLFGMREARTRIKTAKGTQYSHAYYENWRESVYDYAFYQCRYLSRITNEEEYLEYLSQSYAEDPNYISKIRKLIEKENLREIFK
jgi:hypothetical protein